MIIYNWKAEFHKKQIARIEKCQKQDCIPGNDYVSDVNLIKEMANALDRYEAMLNEIEGDVNYGEPQL